MDTSTTDKETETIFTYDYQPPLLTFLKHRINTNPDIFVEAVLYSLAIGIFVYIVLQIVSYRHIFYTLLTLVFFYTLFTSNNKSIKGFFKRLQYVATNTKLRTPIPTPSIS